MLPKTLQRKQRMRWLHLYPDSLPPLAAHNISHQLPGPCPVFKTLSTTVRRRETLSLILLESLICKLVIMVEIGAQGRRARHTFAHAQEVRVLRAL